MEKAKILVFPGVQTKPVESVAPKVKPGKCSGKAGLRMTLNVLLFSIVILNKPLSWTLNALFGFYSMAWFFSGSGLHGGAALMALGGAVLVKYILLAVAKSARKH